MGNTQKKKILIIEDEAPILSMYKTEFENNGFLVFAAGNGEDGLKLAQEKIPDLVLLDIILPGLDGFAVLKEIKANAKTKNIPVVMLTNLGTSEDKIKGESFGAADYLVKASLTPIEIAQKAETYIK
jgi:two-component system alkaline phosphatase synthesis response regulator PhoP